MYCKAYGQSQCTSGDRQLIGNSRAEADRMQPSRGIALLLILLRKREMTPFDIVIVVCRPTDAVCSNALHSQWSFDLIAITSDA